MNLQRLAVLSNHLRTNALPTFYFGHWNQCAMYEATRIPEFHRDGLRATVFGNMPTFNEHSPLRTAMEFFGLNQYEARWLFVENSECAHAGAVANRIDEMIAIEIRKRALADVAAVTQHETSATVQPETSAIVEEVPCTSNEW